MSLEKPKPSLLKNVSGLDTQEIRVEHSINEMITLLRRTNSVRKREYLLNEIEHRKRELKSIRKTKAN